MGPKIVNQLALGLPIFYGDAGIRGGVFGKQFPQLTELDERRD